MSDRKLRGLLGPATPIDPKPLSNPLSIKNVHSPCLSPNFIAISQKTTAIIKQHNTPVYYEIPGVQNFFYYPFVRNDSGVEKPQQSPWLEPFKIASLKDLPPLSHASAHTAADSRGDQTGNHTPDNDGSRSLCYLVKTLAIKASSQPKNLEELLQKSFQNMPSYSILKSPFHSALPSPFPQNHTSFMFQGGFRAGSANEISMRGNSYQKSPFIGAQALKPPTNMETNDALLSHLADMMSQNDGDKVRSEIVGLLVQFNSNGNLQQPNSPQRGLGLIPKERLERGERNQQLISNFDNTTSTKASTFIQNSTGNNTNSIDPYKPKKKLLSNGIEMNAVERSPKTSRYVAVSVDYKQPSCLRDTKIEAARKELFVISESSEKRSDSKPEKSQNINLFEYQGAPITFPTANRNNLSPLISSSAISKNQLNLNLLSQPYNLTSQSNSHQAASLSTNSSHSDNQKGISLNKKTAFELSGKPEVRGSFRLIDDFPIPSQMLNTNFAQKEKLTNKPLAKGKAARQTTKKSRGKGKFVTVEEYVKHVNINKEDDSNLTIEETWEEDDEDDWDDAEEVKA